MSPNDEPDSADTLPERAWALLRGYTATASDIARRTVFLQLPDGIGAAVPRVGFNGGGPYTVKVMPGADDAIQLD